MHHKAGEINNGVRYIQDTYYIIKMSGLKVVCDGIRNQNKEKGEIHETGSFSMHVQQHHGHRF